MEESDIIEKFIFIIGWIFVFSLAIALGVLYSVVVWSMILAPMFS